MAAPRTLVFNLHKYWDVVESLVRATRETQTFTREQVLAVIARHHPDLSAAERDGVLRTLGQSDILAMPARTEVFELNSLVLDFVRGLTREHELGLSAVLKARVEAVKSATDALTEGIAEGDPEAMRTGAGRLGELFTRIEQQLEQDRHAIVDIGEQAKSADTAIPLARRYRTVLEAYDQYVEPMNEMMDTGPEGTFYPYLEAAEQALDQAYEQLNVVGALYTHRLQLRQVGYRAKELRRMGRVVAQKCAETLLPLREEARQHNNLSAAVSTLLGQVRKCGLRRAVARRTANSELPVWRVERQQRVSVGDEVKTIMAQARDYEPVHKHFPEELSGEENTIEAWVDEQALRSQLAQSLPVPDLMRWLHEQYPELPDAVILRLYHDLIQEPGWQVSQHHDPVATALTEVRVHYYPHELESS
ncbi:hypothetical protein ACMDCT_13215 [Halomonadaceae bacterium KBTZ08]